jgi:hypothetical protein
MTSPAVRCKILTGARRVTKPRDQTNERLTKEHSRQILDLALTLDPHLRQVDVNGGSDG